MRNFEMIQNQIDMLTKKVSNASNTPQAWLTFDKQGKAKELREKNPETFDYICEILKLYF